MALRDRLHRLERRRVPEADTYDPGQYEDPDEVRAWLEELLSEYGLESATPEEQSKFLDAFARGVVGDSPDWRADA